MTKYWSPSGKVPIAGGPSVPGSAPLSAVLVLVLAPASALWLHSVRSHFDPASVVPAVYGAAERVGEQAMSPLRKAAASTVGRRWARSGASQ